MVTPSNLIFSKEYINIFTNPNGYYFSFECSKLLMSAFGKYPKMIRLSFIQFRNAAQVQPPHIIEFLSGLEALCLSGIIH